MTFIAGILTVLLVVNSLLLIFLVLIQLPKKDAGAGLAFGSGAADALFGAGSGNALTKITKYAIITFVLLTLGLGYVEESIHRPNVTNFEKAMQQSQSPISSPGTPAMSPATTPMLAPSNTTTTPAPASMPTPAPAAPAAAGTNTSAK